MANMIFFIAEMKLYSLFHQFPSLLNFLVSLLKKAICTNISFKQGLKQPDKNQYNHLNQAQRRLVSSVVVSIQCKHR